MNARNAVRVPTIAALFVLCETAEAQISRVFVSVNGNDGNACSNLATPCRTINGGITQVDANGEVIIIDTGSYAGGTIVKAVKVNAAPGVVAFSGLPIIVNPGVGNTVVLRNLTIKAVTPGVGAGVTHSSGNLFIEDAVLDGWATGVTANSTGQLSIQNSTLRNMTTAGVNAVLGKVLVDRVQILNSFVGVSIPGGNATVTRSTISGNTSKGIHITNESGGVARVSGCVVVNGGIGLHNQLIDPTPGQLFVSMGDNVVEGNTTNTQGMITSGVLK